jgi:hypothetical protein
LDKDEDVEFEVTRNEVKALREFAKPTVTTVKKVREQAQKTLDKEKDLSERERLRGKLKSVDMVVELLEGLMEKLK